MFVVLYLNCYFIYNTTIRQIWICGEVMTSSLRDRMENIAPWVKMFNFYSVSECHDVTCAGK